MDDLGSSATPSLELLQYLKEHKKSDPMEVPFVELHTMAVPEWST